MATVCVKYVPEFYFGDDVVLLAADREGIDAFERSLSEAASRKPALQPLISCETVHEFIIGAVETRIELEVGCVIWHLPEAKASEIIEKVAVLKAAPHPSHHYVEIDCPVKTLVLSIDEYLDSSLFNDRATR
jgi:hypothetical protein